MIGSDLMPFGKHKNCQMQDVPVTYLSWFMSQEWAEKKYPDVFLYAKNAGVKPLVRCVGDEDLYPTEPDGDIDDRLDDWWRDADEGDR